MSLKGRESSTAKVSEELKVPMLEQKCNGARYNFMPHISANESFFPSLMDFHN